MIISKISTGSNFNNITIKSGIGIHLLNRPCILLRINYYFQSAYEGLTFDYLSCKKIISFLNKNDSIKNLFNGNHFENLHYKQFVLI